MSAENWLVDLSTITGPSEAAQLSRLRYVTETVQRGVCLAPHPERNPDAWSVERDQCIMSLRHLEGIDELRARALNFPAEFAAWRTHCHNLEAQNAARLQVLVWCLQTLYALRHDQELAEIAGQLADKIADSLQRGWRIDPSTLPVTGSYRDWCTRATRNYRMLPKAWRYV